MIVPNMGYVTSSWYNVVIVLLSLKQTISFFSRRTQAQKDSSVHCIICIGHVNENHFVQVN